MAGKVGFAEFAASHVRCTPMGRTGGEPDDIKKVADARLSSFSSCYTSRPLFFVCQVHGQGHCHTVSSVMFAIFKPFSRLLGIDLRYRGG